METTSICTSCMNRSTFLEMALPTWINQPVNNIIVLDWSSRESIKPIIDKNQNGKVILAVVSGKEFFNKSKTDNLKARLTKFHDSKYFLSIDCDVIIKDGFFENHPMLDLCFFSGDIDNKTHGTHLISYENFMKVNGHNEALEGWGWDDVDFYRRLRSSVKWQRFTRGFLEHIPHDDSIRVENYPIKDKLESWDRNKHIKNSVVWGLDRVQEPQEITLYYPDNKIVKVII